MRNKPWVIVDCSSIFKACLYAGKDKENGFEVEHEGKPVWVNGWQFGMENVISSVCSMLEQAGAAPMDLIFVTETDGTRLRRNIYPEYKGNRGSKPKEWSEQYQRMEDEVKAFFLRLGSMFVTQPGLEADDICAFLCRRLGGVKFLMMNDMDGLALHDGVNVIHRYMGQLVDEHTNNPLGPFPFRMTRIYKALVGDKSDNLKGAVGFGEMAFVDLYGAIGEAGMDELAKVIQNGQWKVLEQDAAAVAADHPKLAKIIQKILDSRSSVQSSWKCAGFFDHLVNSPRQRLQWDVGMTLEAPEGVPDRRLAGYYQTRRLVTSKNFGQYMTSDAWLHIAQSPWISLDLETSTPPESDDWLRLVNQLDEDDPISAVDVIASEITGMGLTFGANGQYTLYFTVNHATEDNITKEQLYLFLNKLLQREPELRINVHNSSFELPVLKLNLGEWTNDNDLWDDGYLPNVDDTLFLASYVNENVKIGLKAQAQSVLKYEQVTYDEVVTCPTTGRRRKMHELTPKEVFGYGTDDTIVTHALRNYYQAITEIEATFHIYQEVEMPAAYLCASGIVSGTEFNREEMRRQEQEDEQLYEKHWVNFRDWLVREQWDGVELPAMDLTPSSMKLAYQLVTGRELETKVRTPAKIAILMAQDPEAATLAELYEAAIRTGDMAHVENYVRPFHDGEPKINLDSPAQVCKLLYEKLELPTRVRNKPTADMKKAGIREGNPAGNALAINTALFYDCGEAAGDRGKLIRKLLNDIVKMRSVATRRKMFYKPYRYLKHWKTGRIHGSYGQCFTATRRFAPSKPNLAQLPKDKGDFRACFVPHHKDAVIVSLDFNAQELRVIADFSRDENMVSCYVGDSRRDLHHLTGLAIAQKKVRADTTYEEFALGIDDRNHPEHAVFVGCRKKAKTVNFASEYGAQGPKMAETLMVPLEEAESYLEAKHSTFWRAEQWKKDEVIPEAKKQGFATTMLGGLRHLQEAFQSDDWSISSRAERQAVNFKIQGSCAEMTKLAMGRVWKQRLLQRFDASFFAPIHDELVFSVAIKDIVPFIQELHAAMVAPYANMWIPLESSIGIGLDFKNLIEIGKQPDADKILAAVRELRPELEVA